MRAEFLAIKSKIVLIGLEQTIKDAEIIHVSPSCTTIKCKIKDGDSWKYMSEYTISNGTEVRFATEQDLRKEEGNDKEKGLPRGYTEEEYRQFLLEQINKIENGESVAKTPPKKAIVANNNSNNRDNDSLKFPKSEFTVAELAELNGISKALAYSRMQGKVRAIKEIGSGRGRKTKVYITTF